MDGETGMNFSEFPPWKTGHSVWMLLASLTGHGDTGRQNPAPGQR